ncbi:MAG: ABC transporter ATP-binding protein [Candidatus Phytoplasma stylosanthis]|uniref:ABC transporter ATP-binding protein n=1 Tax=Candidatus Phytoplasma stylosanthis TaxID=2798314 RepID=UPI002939BD30|nr:ABC transporter ATP-binding protein [Candidatus Phytoplasma stylosanthis]MDV3167805.1 ABC transporter ATP-binding protein [Candidatus Phytoplasma stylosanthis]MDV3170918.1 ABC transporter ATP-binding protein [Candidatus Phytoplasma stylosanthis]MDV3174098.1 ABC transporter ATP-binding protein [Candidatus Phytoplasma stylosanthis]
MINIFSFLLILCGELTIPWIIGRHIIQQGGNNSEYFRIILFFILMIFIIVIGYLLMNYSVFKISSLLFQDLSNDLFKKINTFSVSEIQNLGVSAIVNRITYNIYQITNFIVSFYKTAFFTPIVIVSCFFIIQKFSIALTYGILFVTPCFIFILILIIKKNFFLSLSQYAQLEKLNYKIRSDLTGTKVIRSLNKENKEQKNFHNINSRFKDLIIKLFVSIIFIEPLFYLLLNGSIILTIFIASGFIRDGQFSIGDLYITVTYNFKILSSILSFLLLFMMLPKTLIAVRKIEFLFNIEPSIKNNLNQVLNLDRIKTLEFKNVSFRYYNSVASVLKNISFKINESEIIAFVGKTGSGKTTLIDLIPRLIDPVEGKIEINGMDIKNYDLKSLRDKIGFVSQKNILFKGTILSNLLFGKKDAQEDEILNQLKISQSYEFIQNKEKKLKEPVSELGSNLSGGQKQRLSITRTFLKQPDVYVFDDSFSALDYETDLAIRKSFFEDKKKAIVIIVAQRLTSILQADQIIVLDKGEIVNIGKHKELIKKCSVYRSIAISQNIEEVITDE